MIMGDICTRRCPFCDVGPRPAAAARRRRAREPRADDRGAEARATSSSPASTATTCATAARSTSSTASARCASTRPRTQIEVLVPGFPRPARPRARRSSTAAPPDVMNHNLETVPRLYKQARPGLGLRALARAAARVQGARSRRPDQVRADGGPGRDRRRDPRGDARHARARHRHADDRPVPAADRRATCRCCATCIRTRSRCSSARRTRWASGTPPSARWCARRTTPTGRPKEVLRPAR